MNVHITLLGGFAVTVDGAAVPADAWSRRHASALVKVLALARSRRLHRDQVIDLLWPDTPPEAAMPRLHKAAHFARRALGPDGTASVVLRNDVVALWPGAEVVVDAARYRAEAESALAAGSAERAVEALSLYGGPLLPDDLYEPWTPRSPRVAAPAAPGAAEAGRSVGGGPAGRPRRRAGAPRHRQAVGGRGRPARCPAAARAPRPGRPP